MHSDQREGCSGMVKAHRLPIRGAMASGAVSTQLPVVCIIQLVARKTIHGRAFIHAVDVAILTGDTHMRADQFEGRQIVIETSRLPALRGVAGCAIRPQTALMRIVDLMARETVPRSPLQSRQCMLSAVAFPAGDFRMFPCQHKSEEAVIEIIAKSINAVMTIETSIAEYDNMVDHERRVDLTMTFFAGPLIKAHYIIFVRRTASLCQLWGRNFLPILEVYLHLQEVV